MQQHTVFVICRSMYRYKDLSTRDRRNGYKGNVAKFVRAFSFKKKREKKRPWGYLIIDKSSFHWRTVLCINSISFNPLRGNFFHFQSFSVNLHHRVLFLTPCMWKCTLKIRLILFSTFSKFLRFYEILCNITTTLRTFVVNL